MLICSEEREVVLWVFVMKDLSTPEELWAFSVPAGMCIIPAGGAEASVWVAAFTCAMFFSTGTTYLVCAKALYLQWQLLMALLGLITFLTDAANVL